MGVAIPSTLGQEPAHPTTVDLNSAQASAAVHLESGNSVCAVSITGTFSATLTFEVSVDGSLWSNAYPTPTAGAPTNTTTAAFAGSVATQGFPYFRVRASSYSSGDPMASIYCVPVVNTELTKYVLAQATASPYPQTGNDYLNGYRVAAASNSPALNLLTAGDFLSSESTAKGRFWAGQAANGAAVGVVYIALSELQAANSLPPNSGDVVTTTINGHAVPYTIVGGDTTVGAVATNVAAAINADSTSNTIVSAAGSSSGQIGLVTITALTQGICCRYSLTAGVTGSTDETAAAFPLLDIPGNYADYGKNVVGWTLSTNLGNYTFDHSGNFVGPAGHNFIINEGAGAPSALAFNFNAPGNYDGIAIYDGGTNVNHADLLYPMNVHIITGPLEAEICQYTANNCTSAPTNPGYVGEWLNVNGSNSGPTQHQQFGTCAANTTCTLNWGVQWTSATSYSCVITAEGSGDAPYISTKTASQTVFTGSTSVARDFLCSGI
jgi:hypothetical protein